MWREGICVVEDGEDVEEWEWRERGGCVCGCA